MNSKNLKPKILILDELNITYQVRRLKTKRITLKFNNGILQIIVPKYYNNENILLFIDKHLEWIKENYQKVQKKQRQYIDDEDFLLLGKNYKTKYYINKHEQVIKTTDTLIIYSSTKERSKIVLENYIKETSDLVLNEMLTYCFNKMKNVLNKYPKLIIKQYKSRWGACCPSKNELMLNKTLIHLSVDLIEFVICHELAHYVHLNHSKEFHEFLRKFVPNENKLRKEISKYNPIYE